MVQKDVVAEEQKLKDTEAFATADREKRVILTMAEADAEQDLVKEVKKAEASKRAAELGAQQSIVEAAGEETASVKIAAGKKSLAEGITAEQAAAGLAEANVMEARARATRAQGEAEAEVMRKKFDADADGITKKAEAMKKFHEAGREHEEFKIRSGIAKDVALAEIGVRKDIAEANSRLVGEALKNAKVEIVGGEAQFFDRIVNAVSAGKAVDRAVEESEVLADVREAIVEAGRALKGGGAGEGRGEGA